MDGQAYMNVSSDFTARRVVLTIKGPVFDTVLTLTPDQASNIGKLIHEAAQAFPPQADQQKEASK